jgi:UDP-glucose 4-epimerase
MDMHDKVLVTGAAGFLGSSLVARLCRSDHHVRDVLHDSTHPLAHLSNVETVVADIRDAKTVQDIADGCGAIVHLAAKVHAIDDSRAEMDYEAVNVVGTKHILDAAVRSGVNRIASSVKVFGEETSECIDETQAPDPRTAYGRSKWRAEQLVSEYAERHGLTAVSLRLPMVYGPTKRGNLYRMIEAIDHGRFPVLPRLSFQAISGIPASLTTQQLTKLIGCAWYSSKTATHELGYQAAYSFEKTVPELIALS